MTNWWPFDDPSPATVPAEAVDQMIAELAELRALKARLDQVASIVDAGLRARRGRMVPIDVLLDVQLVLKPKLRPAVPAGREGA